MWCLVVSFYKIIKYLLSLLILLWELATITGNKTNDMSFEEWVLSGIKAFTGY